MKVPHFTTVGCYPLFYYVESDKGKFHSCPSCINNDAVGNISRCDTHVNYEDETLTCEVCEKKIESAYGE